MVAEVVCTDVLDWAAEYDGPLFHALLCDPPYELGFMGKDWDKSGIAFKKGTWKALARHLHPGAFGMAFASARGWHRLAVAIEDAGLRIHPTIFGWSYGSGFPKATRVDTQIDKAAGVEREVVGEWKPTGTARPNKGSKGHSAKKTTAAEPDYDPQNVILDITAPATPLAAAWQGHRYGLQAMKPALEPIIVFQKPYAGKPVECITATGAGALWIDGGRIGTGDNLDGGAYCGDGARETLFGLGNTGKEFEQPTGRWPANFHLTHHPSCRRVGMEKVNSGTAVRRNIGVSGKGWAHNGFPDTKDDVSYANPNGLETITAYECHPECPARKLGEQSGERRASMGGGTHRTKGNSWFTHPEIGQRGRQYYDKGTAARFFFQADWSYEVAEQIAAADPVRYVAKAARKERDAGLDDDFPEGEPPGSKRSNPAPGRKRALGQPRRNHWPTVKPIALTRWLATLLLPPPEYEPRRILIPFCGSGSEGIGAGLAGWDEMTLIDMEAEACELAEARIAHWLNQSQPRLFGA